MPRFGTSSFRCCMCLLGESPSLRVHVPEPIRAGIYKRSKINHHPYIITFMNLVSVSDLTSGIFAKRKLSAAVCAARKIRPFASRLIDVRA